jgi:hypothetical protein
MLRLQWQTNCCVQYSSAFYSIALLPGQDAKRQAAIESVDGTDSGEPYPGESKGNGYGYAGRPVLFPGFFRAGFAAVALGCGG